MHHHPWWLLCEIRKRQSIYSKYVCRICPIAIITCILMYLTTLIGAADGLVQFCIPALSRLKDTCNASKTMSWLLVLIILGVGFIQLPMLLDILSSTTGRRVSMLKTSHRVLQLFVVACTLGVFVGVYAVFVIYHMPALWASSHLSFMLHAIPLTWLWFMALLHYGASVMVAPSMEQKQAKRVPGFDHTCPFTMNYVWDGNIASFYFFINYVCLGLLYASVSTFGDFYQAWIQPLLRGSASDGVDSLSLVFVGASAIFQAMTVFWAWQTLLLLLDCTTPEAITQVQEHGVLATLWSCFQPRSHLRFQRLIRPHLGVGLLYGSNLMSDKASRLID
jgi:hypothetical protein